MKAWLFDVDGVITHPEIKKANPEIIKKISDLLEKGDIIGFNTGRSLEFVIEEVLKPLEENVSNKKFLEKVFSVGEKGGDWAYFKNSILEIQTDKSLALPIELEEKIKKLIADKYSETTFFDDSKKTMISTEIIKGTNLSKFHDDQKNLEKDLEKILKESNLDNLNIDASIIATDIQNPKVGKDLGVHRFLDMIKGLHEPEEFETFGDSPSDLEMYKYLKKKGHKAKFIYVGKREIEYSENHSEIIITDAKYDEGILAYFNSN